MGRAFYLNGDMMKITNVTKKDIAIKVSRLRSKTIHAGTTVDLIDISYTAWPVDGLVFGEAKKARKIEEVKPVVKKAPVVEEVKPEPVVEEVKPEPVVEEAKSQKRTRKQKKD